MIAQSMIDLLWPPEVERPTEVQTHFAEHGARDLGLEALARGLTDIPGIRTAIHELLLLLSAETAVIRYRQDILEDLRSHPRLVAELTELLPHIFELSQVYHRRVMREDPLHEVMRRLSELETIVHVVGALGRILTPLTDLQSRGLLALASAVGSTTSDPVFQQLTRELPALLDTMRAAASLTVGINLNADLEPVEAVLLAVNTERYVDGGLLDKLFGKNSAMTGIAPLHSVPGYKGAGMLNGNPASFDAHERINPKLVPLFRDLSEVVAKSSKPILKQIQRYAAISGRYWARLYIDLGFYLGAIVMIERMAAAGLPMCRPQIQEPSAREYYVIDNYNINLALHMRQTAPDQPLADKIVGNEVNMGENGRIFILTGPNQGGKTTYIQAIGLTQVLAQAGMYVPGSAARISPVDNILTHYPIEEKLEKGTGRFGDEAQRLQAIFKQVTPHSLVLLNESLASTAAGESHYLAVDIMRAFRIAGARVVFATHLHELAEDADKINATTDGSSRVISVVASRIGPESENTAGRSYKIVPGAPMGRSYARELAQRYGVSYEQLTILLAGRE